MDKRLSKLIETFRAINKKKIVKKALISYLFVILLLLPVLYHVNKVEAQIDIRLKEVTEKLQKNPYNPDLLTEVAWVYFESGRLQKALNSIEKAIEIDRKHISANYLAGLIFTDLKRFQDGEDAFHVVLEQGNVLGEGTVLALYGLGLLYKEKKDYVSAIQFINEAIAEKPYKPELHLELGILYWEIGNKPLAENSFNKALSINGDVLPIIKEIKSKR